MERERIGLTRVYTWRIHDFDGTTHILTWEDSTGDGAKIAQRFTSCLCSRCQSGRAMPFVPAGSTSAHAPELLSVAHDCAAKARISDLREASGPDASEYQVTVVVGEAARSMVAGEIPLGRYLGGRQTVSSATGTGIDKRTLVGDVESCLGTAAAGGAVTVVADCGAGGGLCASVRAMIDRFDTCLRSRSYLVELHLKEHAPPLSGQQ